MSGEKLLLLAAVWAVGAIYFSGLRLRRPNTEEWAAILWPLVAVLLLALLVVWLPAIAWGKCRAAIARAKAGSTT